MARPILRLVLFTVVPLPRQRSGVSLTKPDLAFPTSKPWPPESANPCRPCASSTSPAASSSSPSFSGISWVVLQLGSATCPVFRCRRHGIARLARELGDRVGFLVLYTREAPPVGSPSPYTGEPWDPWINRLTGVRLRDTTTTEDRRRRADEARERLGLIPLLVVDPQGDPGWSALGRALSAAVVIDASGRVVARQVWVDPQGLRRALFDLLGPER